ncbi:MAG: radical SAM protein [Terrimicrobiaceae bacterium]|nr:hypothetical protein [Terrimicrobiaceae bacterium]
MRDPFGRKIDYLRISVTDRCNEKCLYCMPEGYKGWSQRSDHMSAVEIARTVGAAADLGFRKFRITGGRLDAVLKGIASARSAGFEVIKLNCVLLRNINESEYLPLIHFAAGIGAPPRFIELMPLSRTGVLDEENFLSVGDLKNRLAAHGELVELPDYRPGHGPARYFSFEPAGARLGFIGALTPPHFCESCNKLRLTADGKLRPCLGRHGEVDLPGMMRSGEEPAAALRAAIDNKPEDHEFLQAYQPHRPMTAIGG